MTALGGRVPVNPSAASSRKATPWAQPHRSDTRGGPAAAGESDGRQVKDARWGLTQNMGGTGASSVVHIFTRA